VGWCGHPAQEHSSDNEYPFHQAVSLNGGSMAAGKKLCSG
jgi:hypothetical protein